MNVMDMEWKKGLIIHNIKENLKIIILMGTVLKLLQMVIFIMDTLNKEKEMD
jgi:hypothetical protein